MSPWNVGTGSYTPLQALVSRAVLATLKLLICCSVAQSCPILCHLMDCSTPSFPVLHYVPEFAQIQVH